VTLAALLCFWFVLLLIRFPSFPLPFPNQLRMGPSLSPTISLFLPQLVRKIPVFEGCVTRVRDLPVYEFSFTSIPLFDQIPYYFREETLALFFAVATVGSTAFAEEIFLWFWGCDKRVEVVMGFCFLGFVSSVSYQGELCLFALLIWMVTDSEGGEFAAIFEDGEVEADGVGKDD